MNILPTFCILLMMLTMNLGTKIYTELTKNTLETSSQAQIHLEYVLLDDSNPCARKCIQGDSPMICTYNFTIESYYTLSKACYDCPLNVSHCFLPDCIPGDGTKRSVVSVNRQIPGPTIEVCQNDIIVVDVHNKIMSESTTIHWHGQHQLESPYMDGVPYVTQCPILPGNTFRYTFKTVNHGTHFWHSHIGMQRSDGAFGPLLVRVPEEVNPVVKLYDYDLTSHVINLIDWTSVSGVEKFLAHHHAEGDNKPTTLLVNGLGRYKEFDGVDNETVYMPTARFYVEKGFRYRFRVINAGFLNCPIEISIDYHNLTVISSDGSDFQPIEATSLVTYAGERFDFVLNADQPTGLYWIRFRGLMDCDERFGRAHQVAVLQYKGGNETEDDYPQDTVDYDKSHRTGVQVNGLNIGTEDNSTQYISMPQLESFSKWDVSLKRKADEQFYIAYDFYTLDNSHFHKSPYYAFSNFTDVNLRLLSPQFNHISMKMPTFPILPQRNQINPNMFCNEDTMKNQNCTENFCECVHGITVPLDSVVEIILVDEGFAYDANHPIHLHGHSFRVVAMERLGRNITVEEVKQKDKEGLIQRNLIDPPVKDTVTVPDGGYTIIRFFANNPGYWIFHCHIEFHAEIGMALVLKIGEDNQMLPVPHNFPSCGDYLSSPVLDKDGSVKRDCSKNRLVKEVEKLVFGDEECYDFSVGSSTSVSRYSLMWLLTLMLYFVVR